jgi:hypothetical protein
MFLHTIAALLLVLLLLAGVRQLPHAVHHRRAAVLL